MSDRRRACVTLLGCRHGRRSGDGAPDYRVIVRRMACRACVTAQPRLEADGRGMRVAACRQFRSSMHLRRCRAGLGQCGNAILDPPLAPTRSGSAPSGAGSPINTESDTRRGRDATDGSESRPRSSIECSDVERLSCTGIMLRFVRTQSVCNRRAADDIAPPPCDRNPSTLNLGEP